MPKVPGHIVLRNARQHNLKGITVSLPRRAVTVVTGPSGSGKSSLAFDTLYAEGQRRYIESLSTYAKQFLERMPKPLVDALEGLSPAVAIEQKNPTTSSRSTVGTATEIYDYMRLLWARIGTPHCRACGAIVKTDTCRTRGCDPVGSSGPGSGVPILITFPLPAAAQRRRWPRRSLRAAGFVRALADGALLRLDDAAGEPLLRAAAEVLVIVDRVPGAPSRGPSRSRRDGLRRGRRRVDRRRNGSAAASRSTRTCSACETAALTLVPSLFSFNNPRGVRPATASAPCSSTTSR
jgi:excinuclease ABC subunit A